MAGESERRLKKSILRAAIRGLGSVTGNRVGQRVLDVFCRGGQLLQGIGFGAGVETSGEVSVLQALRRMAPASGVRVFDVGANKGQFLSCVLDELEGIPYDIHAFEPGASTYASLKEQIGNRPRVTLNNCALGKVAGEHSLFYDVPGSGIASLTQRSLDHFGRSMLMSETVSVDTLDTYCAARNIDHIGLLKIDVEGHELDVLEGGQRLFNNGAISLVTIEFGGANIDTRTFVRDMFNFFADAGMTMARITPSGYWYECKAYQESLEQFRTTNFVCYKRGLIPAHS